MLIETFLKHFSNPVANRIFLFIEERGHATAKEISQKISVPQATLYRYLKKMVSDGILTVVDETRVRNVTEKTYAVVMDYKAEIDKMLAQNSGEVYSGLFKVFCNGLINEFEAYAGKDDIDIQNDGSGFRLVPFYASPGELRELAEKVRTVVTPYYENTPTPERQMRNIAIIYTPPMQNP